MGPGVGHFNVFPLADLRESLEYWYSKTKSRITYEYVVWKGINDRKIDIDAACGQLANKNEAAAS